jgi:acyl-coenzyme A synthetase/AMP-(fatty) acid ligase
MIGVVVNPIVPINREAEVKYMLNAARSRVVFAPKIFRGFDYAEMMRRVVLSLDFVPRVVVVRGEEPKFEKFADLLAYARPPTICQAVNPNAVKLLMYTSGTTGRPKAVLHSHNSIHADGMHMRAAMNLGAADTVFCPSPLTHVSGYLWILNMPWLAGIPAVSIEQWHADLAISILRKQRCSVMIGATPFLRELVACIEDGGDTLTSLRHYVCGGAAVPPSLIYRAADSLPNCIPWRTFGSTETTTLTRGPASRADIRLGAETDGRICSAEIKVLDPVTGAETPAGQEGELLVRGPGMMLGYTDEADNAAAYDAEGFFRMGDLVRIIEGDHIVCTGRAKDLIIRAGENISAKEIEDVLLDSPRIAEAAVVSMPSARTGEAICAFLVMRPGESIDLPEIDTMFRHAGLARQKTPEHLQLIDALPKTAAGKIRKDVLRKMAASIGAEFIDRS